MSFLLCIFIYWQNVGSSLLPILKIVFLLSAESYLYIMDMTFVRYFICKYFSQSDVYLFVSLVVTFEEQKQVQLSFSHFYSHEGFKTALLRYKPYNPPS